MCVYATHHTAPLWIQFHLVFKSFLYSMLLCIFKTSQTLTPTPLNHPFASHFFAYSHFEAIFPPFPSGGYWNKRSSSFFDPFFPFFALQRYLRAILNQSALKMTWKQIHDGNNNNNSKTNATKTGWIEKELSELRKLSKADWAEWKWNWIICCLEDC